jgi:hypothetical protein
VSIQRRLSNRFPAVRFAEPGNDRYGTQNSQLNLSTSYIAQVDLPEGARIDTATCFGYDTASMENFGFGLYRYRFNGLGNPVFEDITNFVSSSGTSGYVELAALLVDPVDPPGLPVINNENYSYGLYLELPKATAGELYVVRCVVRASIESTSHFRQIEIK